MVEVAIALAGNVGLVGAVALIFKLWLETSLKNSSIQFAKGLDAANNREIERLRTELRLTEGRTTRFDERRFEALNEVYSALAEANDAFDRWTRIFRDSGAPSEEEDGQRAVEAYDTFLKALNRNKLWLGRELAEHAEGVRNALRDAWADFVDPEMRDRKRVRAVMGQQVPGLRDSFEQRAQELLTAIEQGAAGTVTQPEP